MQSNQKNTILKTIVLSVLSLMFVQCHSSKWVSLQTEGQLQSAPQEIISVFNKYPEQLMHLEANSPGFSYKYDIGEKDVAYGRKDSIFRFVTVQLQLKDKMPKGTVLVDISFTDSKQNSVYLFDVDLLKLTPKFDTSGDMIYPEIIEEEFNRFGYVFRKEHDEFLIRLQDKKSQELQQIKDRAYRCSLTNNCLAATKWEFQLNSEVYTDYDTRLNSNTNLNQNKILSHSWFYIDKDLYKALIQLKNPNKEIPYELEYNDISDLAEQTVIDFNSLRKPIKRRLDTQTLEIGFKSGRKIEPLDNELFYKDYFQLFMEGNIDTYTSILQSPVKTAQFKDQGFYTKDTPKEFDLKWMQYLDDVKVDVIDVVGTDAFTEITLTGEWSPYKITIGNIDLTHLNEQKMYGMLFGINTYPKSRRYNPQQSTLYYDAELLPENIKPYVLLTQKENDKWVNNQYKGIEKIYFTYDSLEKDVIQIYVLSYERITPVWMAKVKLPKEVREKLRIRKSLYNY